MTYSFSKTTLQYPMLKRIFVLLFLCPAFFEFACASTITVHYRKTADIFELMDNVAHWWEGFNDSAYREYWEKRFGLSKEDRSFFSQYKVLREKYYLDPDQSQKSPLENRNGFFSTLGSISADPLAEAFYSAQSFEEALLRVRNRVSEEDISFLRRFYTNFEDRYTQILKTGSHFDSFVEKTRVGVQLTGVESYLQKIKTFYRVQDEIQYDVLYVWFPPVKRSQATPTGKYLVMRFNPETNEPSDDSDIVFHEIVHTISSRQDLETKRALTKVFLETCDLRKPLKKLVILEEPLAVAAGQMLFQETFQPKRFQFDAKWYNNAWISMYAKSIYPLLKQYIQSEKSLDEEFVRRAAKMCAEIVQATKGIHAK